MSSLKDTFLEINTPEELLDFMNNNIKLGMYGSNKRLYDTSDLDSFELASNIYWNLSTPSNTLKTTYGNLYDQVELERDWFIKNGYEIKTIYITYLVNYTNSYPTHAYLVYKDKDKWKWFEHSDRANRGIHEYDSLNDLIKDQKNKHISYTSRFNPVDDSVLDSLHIFEYKKPKSGINTKEFIEFVLNSQEVPVLE